MRFNSAKFVIPALILAAGLLAAPFSFASSITGDTFTVTVSEESVPLAGTESGVAGFPGIDVSVSPNLSVFNVDWIDDNTFKLDWYSGEGSLLLNLTIALTDLNFSHNGTPVDITGVKISVPPGGFNWDKKVSVTANSITIVYPGLDDIQAADGEYNSYDVTTATPVPVPATLPLLATGLGMLIFAAANRRR